MISVCLPTCGHGRGNRARTPARASASRTRASRSGDTSRNGRLARPCDRSAYTYTPSGRSPALLVSFSRVPLGKTPTVTARGTLGSCGKATHTRLSLRGKARLLPRAAYTIRVTMLRRRDTASSPRSRLVSHHANRRLAVPLRLLLARVALPRPSIRRVFLRSLCARRCPIDSLSLVRGKSSSCLISA